MFRLVAKRLLLLPVTLLGVSMLIFALVAVSPGGVGGSDEISAETEAYLQERYGLEDPPAVQYGRWLLRVCPVRFGELDQVDGDGRVVRMPGPLQEPPLWRWYAEALPKVDGRWVGPDRTAPAKDRYDAYRAALRVHGTARSAYLRELDRWVVNAKRYAMVIGKPEPKSDADYRALGEPRKELPEYGALAESGKRVVALYGEAIQTRAMVLGALEARPFESDGVAIIPGVLGLAWPDLGESAAFRRPVSALLREALPQTLLLNGASLALLYLIAIPSGVLAAVRRGTWIDSFIGLLFTTLWSIPVAAMAILALGYLSGAPPRGLGWFPVVGLHGRQADAMAFLPGWGSAGFEPGYVLDTLWHMVLPVVCLGYGGLAAISKHARAATLENLRAEFVRTARAKGAGEGHILLRHVMPNSLLPLITLFVGVFPAMLSGSVVIERTFGIRGMGDLLVQSFFSHDREVLLGVTMILAVVNVLALLLADVLYTLVDPRLRIGGRSGDVVSGAGTGGVGSGRVGGEA